MQIDIEAPPADVWAVVLDPTRLKDWVTIHRHLGAHDGGAPRVGFTMTQTLSLRGAPFRVHWELVRCEEPHLAEWHGRGPAHSRAETEYRLSAHGSGTRFEYRNEFFPRSASSGASPSAPSRGTSRRTRRSRRCARLKRLCERPSHH